MTTKNNFKIARAQSCDYRMYDIALQMAGNSHISASQLFLIVLQVARHVLSRVVLKFLAKCGWYINFHLLCCNLLTLLKKIVQHYGWNNHLDASFSWLQMPLTNQVFAIHYWDFLLGQYDKIKQEWATILSALGFAFILQRTWSGIKQLFHSSAGSRPQPKAYHDIPQASHKFTIMTSLHHSQVQHYFHP